MKAFASIFIIISILSFLVFSNPTDLVLKFKDLTNKSPYGIAKLKESNVKDMVFSKQKNYSVVLLFTSSGNEFGCNNCKDVEQKISRVSKNWIQTEKSTQIFFAKLEVTESPNAFISFGVKGIPEVYIIKPECTIFKASDECTSQISIKESFSSEYFISEISHFFPNETFGISEDINQPVSKISFLYGILFSFLFYCLYNSSNAQKYFRTISLSITILFVLLMCSGYMWNHIKNPTFISFNKETQEPSIFIPSSSSQLGIEVYLVFATYFISTIAFIFLVKAAPYYEDKDLKTLSIFVCMGVLLAMNSYIYSTYGIKSHYYPFRIILP
ncbi:hypothetical protein BB558_007054 [Smittium angustum]|uniref:Uncharacterized protein n=1 Tax=Smittium angustum TaxID=133377 RepID=A0A2U1IW21_SMIAN|nr:hypothetical protein BB558_007054 [Smittium angustum]